MKFRKAYWGLREIRGGYLGSNKILFGGLEVFFDAINSIIDIIGNIKLDTPTTPNMPVSEVAFNTKSDIKISDSQNNITTHNSLFGTGSIVSFRIQIPFKQESSFSFYNHNILDVDTASASSHQHFYDISIFHIVKLNTPDAYIDYTYADSVNHLAYSVSDDVAAGNINREDSIDYTVSLSNETVFNIISGWVTFNNIVKSHSGDTNKLHSTSGYINTNSSASINEEQPYSNSTENLFNIDNISVPQNFESNVVKFVQDLFEQYTLSKLRSANDVSANVNMELNNFEPHSKLSNSIVAMIADSYMTVTSDKAVLYTSVQPWYVVTDNKIYIMRAYDFSSSAGRLYIQ